MSVATAEILFVKCVKDGIPNRDPLNDSDARRLFGEDDGRISLSDVSIKRDVRDYVLAKYPEGGPGHRYSVWCREERTEDGKLRDREALAETILERAGLAKAKDKAKALLTAAYDMRVFGAVFSVEKQSFHRTGPVQFGWAHSLHPVRTQYVQGTTVMPSEGEKGQGTIWTSYYLSFAIFAMPGVINAALAEQTGMDEDDVELLLEALWKGTLQRQARGRGLQKPLLLVHVTYSDPYFRIGFLEDYLALQPSREEWLGATPPTSLAEVALDVRSLAEVLGKASPYANKIAQVRWWKDPELVLKGELPGEMGSPW